MRRRELEVWPALTDVMSTFAVVGLGIAMTLFMSQEEMLLPSDAQALRDMVEELLAEREDLRAKVEASERKAALLQAQNEKLSRMQTAVRVAEDVMRELAENTGKTASSDLSVSFGEDLVTFAENQVEPRLTNEGRTKLRDVCGDLDEALDRVDPLLGVPRREVVNVVVEGHSDSSACRGNPYCNWRFSAGRAAAFRELLMRETYCPGGDEWNARPAGLADTRPRSTAALSRRIEIRVEPRYGQLVRLVEDELGGSPDEAP